VRCYAPSLFQGYKGVKDLRGSQGENHPGLVTPYDQPQLSCRSIRGWFEPAWLALLYRAPCERGTVQQAHPPVGPVYTLC